MAAPVMVIGTVGNVVHFVTVPPATAGTSNPFAAILDLSAAAEGHLVYELATGVQPPTQPTLFAFYRSYSVSMVLPALAAAGQQRIAVPSLVGLTVGKTLALMHSSAPLVGELVTITALIPGSPNSIAVSAPLNYNYIVGDKLYQLVQKPKFVVSPAVSFAANDSCSSSLTLTTGKWVVSITNLDPTSTVVAAVSCDQVSSLS